MEYSLNHMRDRGMSLHRRAHACRSEEEWQELAPSLGVTDPETIKQIWRTAGAARLGGMTKQKAFPLTHEMGEAHTPQCDKCNVEVVNGVPTHEEGCPNSRKTWKYGHYRDGEDDVEENANVIADLYLGETVVTNDRVLNDVLRHAGDIIGRRDVSPIDKFETLFAYLLKARREALGAVDI